MTRVYGNKEANHCVYTASVWKKNDSSVNFCVGVAFSRSSIFARFNHVRVLSVCKDDIEFQGI